MKHKRIWFKNRIGEEVWQGKLKEVERFSEITGISHTQKYPILNKITVTKQNMESLYLSQIEKHYKYYDV